MKNTSILSFLFVIALFASCKKKDTEPYVETPVTVASHPNGYLKNYLACSIVSKTLPLKKNYNSSAYFYSDSMVTDLVEIDSVVLNKKTLKKRSNLTYYLNDSTIAAPESNWHVQGKNGVPVFDHTISLPSYTSYNLLPDSVDLHKDLIIQVSDVLYSTKGTLTLTDNLGKSIVKEYKPGNASVTFTAGELAYLHKYGQLYFYINLFNQETKKFDGKRFWFENQLFFDKYMIPY